jgi:hypothetical protein
MDKIFKVATMSEFEMMVAAKDFTIAQCIVETILSNLNTKKKRLHAFSVECMDKGVTLDITMETKYFVQTLQENMKHYIREERYEDCIEIEKAIKQLQQKGGYL